MRKGGWGRQQRVPSPPVIIVLKYWELTKICRSVNLMFIGLA